jgi:signal transduction histidine kinase
MTFQFTPVVLLLTFTGVTMLAFAVFAWRQRPTPGAGAFVGAMVTLAIWSLAYAGELTVVELGPKLIFARFEYIGIAFVPVAWLNLAESLSFRKHWLNRDRMLALCLMPAATVVLVFTAEAHTLFWTTTAVSADGPLVMLVNRFGPWFWIHSLYSYFMLLAGTVYLIERFLRTRDMYRWQVVLLIVAVLAPWAANIVYLAGLLPPPAIDPTPLAFAVSVLSLGYDMFSYRLFDLMPIARKTVIDTLDDGVLVVDLYGHVADINPAALQMLDPRRAQGEDVVGRPMEALLRVWPEVLALLQSPDADAQPSRDVPFASNRWFEVSVYPLQDRLPRDRGRVVIWHEITARRRSADALAEARDQALAASQLKSQILAKVSHELRTPLGAILGYSEMLFNQVHGPLTGRQQEAAERVIHSAIYLTKLVDDLLDQSQLEQGRLRIHRRPLALEPFLQSIASAQAVEAERKGLAFSLLLTPGLPSHVQADAERVRQILTKLLANAVKFTDMGSISLAVTSGDGDLTFTVSDTGVGVAPEDVAHIYEPFWQAAQDLTRSRDGYGLGLAIVCQLVQLMGGSIALETAAGQGTSFCVHLPLEPVADVDALPAGADH